MALSGSSKGKYDGTYEFTVGSAAVRLKFLGPNVYVSDQYLGTTTGPHEIFWDPDNHKVGDVKVGEDTYFFEFLEDDPKKAFKGKWLPAKDTEGIEIKDAKWVHNVDGTYQMHPEWHESLRITISGFRAAGNGKEADITYDKLNPLKLTFTLVSSTGWVMSLLFGTEKEDFELVFLEPGTEAAEGPLKLEKCFYQKNAEERAKMDRCIKVNDYDGDFEVTLAQNDKRPTALQLSFVGMKVLLNGKPYKVMFDEADLRVVTWSVPNPKSTGKLPLSDDQYKIKFNGARPEDGFMGELVVSYREGKAKDELEKTEKIAFSSVKFVPDPSKK